MAKGKKTKKVKKSHEERMSGLITRKKRGYKLARKVADIIKRSRTGGKLTARDARTMKAYRRWKKRQLKYMTPAQRKAIKARKKTYTKAKRSRAAKLAWALRRKKYGKCGRADPSTFKKGAAKRKANASKAASASSQKQIMRMARV